jgi:hypothetical protein
VDPGGSGRRQRALAAACVPVTAADINACREDNKPLPAEACLAYQQIVVLP